MSNLTDLFAVNEILRCFDDDNIVHVDGRVDPVRDKEIIDYELQIKDLETIDSRIAKVQKQAQTGGDRTEHPVPGAVRFFAHQAKVLSHKKSYVHLRRTVV